MVIKLVLIRIFQKFLKEYLQHVKKREMPPWKIRAEEVDMIKTKIINYKKLG